MTSIEYLGHSGLAIEHDGIQLLCDPWMSPAGAYNASWFQYPEYPHRDLGRLLEPTAVYVSHEHLDHFDPWFMRQLDRDVPILTARLQKRRLVAKLGELGFERIHELDRFEGFEIAPGFVVKIAVPSYNCPPHWFDSCALIEVDGRKIFNLNDSGLALPLDELRAAEIDVFLGQASPAIWYPLTYTCYEPDQKKRLMALRRQSAIESFLTGAKAIGAKLSIPFAGPPCFFDPELVDIFVSPDSMFPTPPISARQLTEETGMASEVLKPGDKLWIEDATNGGGNGHVHPPASFRVERTPAYEDFDYERDRAAYVAARREEKEAIVAGVLADIPEAEPGLFERFRAHFVPLIERNPFFSLRIDIRVLFDVKGPHGGRWIVDFRKEPRAEIVYEDDGGPCQYRFEFDSRNVDQVLRDELSWEDLLLSLRFRAHRDPDRYNQHLFTFLKMGDHRSLQLIAKAEMELANEAADTIVVSSDGKRWEVQRFCPHAGSDLSDAQVVDGHLVCPGHHWHFDLATGECNEAGYRIHCRRLEADETAGIGGREEGSEA
jgi:UDP-MurNAc hydroxylase